MKTIMITFLMVCFSNLVSAQNWTKETVKEFVKEKNVAVVVDLSEATIMDVSLNDYPEYYSGKYSSNTKYANLILDKFKNRFSANFFRVCKKNSISVAEARFVVTYKINSITEKGGFSGTYYVSDKGNLSDTIAFSRKDGRWNDFEVLLMENADKFWKQASGFYDNGNPYKDKLFSKKK